MRKDERYHLDYCAQELADFEQNRLERDALRAMKTFLGTCLDLLNANASETLLQNLFIRYPSLNEQYYWQ